MKPLGGSAHGLWGKRNSLTSGRSWDSHSDIYTCSRCIRLQLMKHSHDTLTVGLEIRVTWQETRKRGSCMKGAEEEQEAPTSQFRALKASCTALGRLG